MASTAKAAIGGGKRREKMKEKERDMQTGQHIAILEVREKSSGSRRSSGSIDGQRKMKNEILRRRRTG